MRIYLDSNIVVYLIEQPSDFGSPASARVARLRTSGDQLVVSDLTRLECRCRPVSKNDMITLAQFDAFFEQSDAEVVQLTRAVCDRATLIRGNYGFRTPDALHLAAAMEAGCDVFLTNDHRLGGFLDVTIEALT